MIKTENNALLPSRIAIGWRICIDYRKLNKVTRKYNFPLPFMDQMLDRLAEHEYNYVLDGYIPKEPRENVIHVPVRYTSHISALHDGYILRHGQENN